MALSFGFDAVAADESTSLFVSNCLIQLYRHIDASLSRMYANVNDRITFSMPKKMWRAENCPRAQNIFHIGHSIHNNVTQIL